MRPILAMAILAALAACQQPAPEPGVYAAACNAEGNLEPEMCDCLDEQAQQLGYEAHRFVVGSIGEDAARVREMREELGRDEAAAATRFEQRGISACFSGQGAG